MQTLGELTYRLGQTDDNETTVTDIAAGAEQHYLSYFMSNLTFEITTFYEVLLEEGQQTILEDNPTMKKIIHNITKVWADTAKWVNPTKRSVSMKLSSLYKYRETLADQVAALAAYDDKLKMYQYVLSRRRSYENLSLSTSDDTLAGELVNFIFEFEDSMTVNDRIKAIYGELPVRMSKIKFHEWVEKALVGMKGISVNDLSNYVAYLQETFYPEGVKGYGEVTPDFFNAMEDLEQLTTDIVATEVVEQMEVKINRLQMVLNDSVSLYTFTASVINNMIGILSVLNETSLKERQLEVDRFIEVMDRLYTRRQEENLIDEAMVKVFDEMTIEFTDAMVDNGKYDGLIDQVKQSHLDLVMELGLAERYDRLSSLYILQSNSYFAPVKVSAVDLELVDERKLIEIKNTLLSYLDQSAKGNTRIEKRARIANLLSVLNIVHTSAQEVHAYIASALSSCRDEREKLACKYILEEIMSTSM